MPVRTVVGIGSREMRSALFVALDSLDDVRVVGSATSAAEIVTLCRSLHPDVALVEQGLSDWDLTELLDAVVAPMSSGDVLVLSADADADVIDRYENAQLVGGMDDLASILGSRSDSDDPTAD